MRSAPCCRPTPNGNRTWRTSPGGSWSFFEASQIALLLRDATTPDEVARRLAARGVTHVLFDAMARPRRLGFPAALGVFLSDPTRVRPLYRSDDNRYSVLEIQDPPVGSRP